MILRTLMFCVGVVLALVVLACALFALIIGVICNARPDEPGSDGD